MKKRITSDAEVAATLLKNTAEQTAYEFRKQTDKNQDQITWFTINNIVPIIASAVMIASSFFLLQTRIALLEQKMDTLIANQERMLQKYEGLETRYGNLSLKVNTLETRGGK